MSTHDKIENTGEKAKGKIKEGMGRLVGNERVEAERKAVAAYLAMIGTTEAREPSSG